MAQARGRVVRVHDLFYLTIKIGRRPHNVRLADLHVDPLWYAQHGDPDTDPAVAALERLVLDQEVIVRWDPASRKRLWIADAEVHLEDGTLLSAEMVRLGYGRVSSGARRLAELTPIQEEARRQGAGAWALYLGDPPVPVPPWLATLAKSMGPSQCETEPYVAAPECGIEPPEPIEKPPLSYPNRMRRRGRLGVVMLAAIIRKDGTADVASVVRSPDPQFSDAAVEAVRTWRYRPARKDGNPVDCHFVVFVEFLLI
jgi:protein TonB